MPEGKHSEGGSLLQQLASDLDDSLGSSRMREAESRAQKAFLDLEQAELGLAQVMAQRDQLRQQLKQREGQLEEEVAARTAAEERTAAVVREATAARAKAASLEDRLVRLEQELSSLRGAAQQGRALAERLTAAAALLGELQALGVRAGALAEPAPPAIVARPRPIVAAVPRLVPLPAARRPAPTTADGPLAPQAAKALAARVFLEMYNQGRLELADEIFTRDYVFHDPPNPAVRAGGEYIKRRMARNLAAFPDMQMTIHDQLTQGDRVVTRFTYGVTHQGELLGLPGTNNRFVFSGINIFRIQDGKLAERWESTEDLSLKYLRRPTKALVATMDALKARDAGSAAEPEAAEARRAPGDPEANAATVRRIYNELFNAGRLELADELFAESYVFHDPPEDPVRCTLAGLKARLGARLRAMPDFRYTIDDLIAEDDRVCVRFTATGTQRGELASAAGTNARITFTGINLLRLEDGRVIQRWEKCEDLYILDELIRIHPSLR